MRGELNAGGRTSTPILDQAEDFEQEAAETIGLTAVLRQGQEVGTVRDRQVAGQRPSASCVAAVEHQLTQLGSEQGQFYAEAAPAVPVVPDEGRHAACLERNARSTPDPIDDELVSRIRWLGEEIDPPGEEPFRIWSRGRRSSTSVRTRLDFVVRRFQQSNFDSAEVLAPIDVRDRTDAAQLETGAVTRKPCGRRSRSHQDFGADVD